MTALCRHFGRCGGCAFQDLSNTDYRIRKRALVLEALSRQGLDGEVSDIVEVPPATRRRCVFKIKRGAVGVAVGFHARGSHTIVDMHECRVLTPSLVALVPRLREIMLRILNAGEACEAHATDADSGIDLMLRWRKRIFPSLTASLASWAGRSGIARIAAGSDILVELEKPAVGIAGARVYLPPGAFLQPTHEGELFLQKKVLESVGSAKSAVDLFAGCGTFALALASTAKVHAVDSEASQLEALARTVSNTRGLKPVTTEKRDLFKHPLAAAELERYDAAVLDPPRAGAAAQIAALAGCRTGRIAYVSCNPESFARDAVILNNAGWRMDPIVPVDQFLWSEHIELVTGFRRG